MRRGSDKMVPGRKPLIGEGGILQISAPQFEAMTRDHFLRKLHAFLLDRARGNTLRTRLESIDDCVRFWSALVGQTDEMDEQAQAVRLSYALACRAQGIDPILPEPGEGGEITMKMQMEEWGMLRFSDFSE